MTIDRVKLRMKLLEKNKVAILAAIVALPFFLRIYGLDRVGLSEDEVHKVNAGRAYLKGDFSANAEHPMLMKLMIALSMAGADGWNNLVSHSYQISEEIAIRFPNLIFGSLTAIIIFLFAQELFGFTTGIISALLWAIGIGAITFNRIAKEDTLLVFFSWLGFYFYLKAKRLGSSRTARQDRLYGLSGASFGLMLSSKYFPHYLALNFIYYYLFDRNEHNRPLRAPNKTFFGEI